MVICFEEKDRAAIEDRGMSIVEFKRFVHKVIDWSKRIIECAVDLLRKIFDLTADVIKEFKEKVSGVLEDMKKWYFSLPEPQRQKIVKWYAKTNRPAVFVNSYKVHHCRNNC